MFSNLGGIPFEWELQSTSSKRPLRVVPFAQSKYEAPDGVRHLEEKKKRGQLKNFIQFFFGNCLLFIAK